MNNNWLSIYHNIKDFISGHPDIRIDASVVSIPQSKRPEFYRLFNAIRETYVKENFPDFINDADVLGNNYTQVNKQAISHLNLNAIDIDQNLSWFLSNPVDGLTRRLFDPLFDLLTGKKDLSDFDDVAMRIIKNSHKTMFHFGYEYWAALSLACLMAPDKEYTVPVKDHTVEPDLVALEGRPGQTENVPEAFASGKITLDVNRITAFLVPNVILHSDLLEAFAALTVDLHDVFCNARPLSKKTEWLKIEDLRTKFGRFNLWPDMCINLNQAADDLRVTADYLNIARPDVVIDVMENLDWYDIGRLEIVKQHRKEFSPRLGTFVICRGPVPEAARRELEAYYDEEQVLSKDNVSVVQTSHDPSAEGRREVVPVIRLLEVGYTRAALEPIIDVMAKSKTMA